MITSVVSRFFYKRLLLAHFKNRSKHNTLRIYYIDNKRAVVFVKNHLFYDEMFTVCLSSLDYQTVRTYLPDSAFIIFNGRPCSKVLDFLIQGRGRRWLSIDRKILKSNR